MGDARDPNPAVEQALRVLAMVGELHKRGFQRLRIVPGVAPSGVYWRCTITHAGNILRTHGALLARRDPDVARYTTGDGNRYFGWEDAREDTARQLAVKFMARFPEIAERGRGRDWAYAGWYVEMLGLAERGVLPVAYADWMGEEPDPRWLPTTEGFQSGLPMPPGGEAEAEGR